MTGFERCGTLNWVPTVTFWAFVFFGNSDCTSLLVLDDATATRSANSVSLVFSRHPVMVYVT